MKTTFCVLLTIILAGCSDNAPPAAAPTPNMPSTPQPVDVENLSSPAPAAETLIVDVRSQEEWDSGHLPQAVHIPHTEIAGKIGDHTSDKTTKIVLYCKAGGRAGKAKEALQEAGFVNVENAGGYDDIKQSMNQTP